MTQPNGTASLLFHGLQNNTFILEPEEKKKQKYYKNGKYKKNKNEHQLIWAVN